MRNMFDQDKLVALRTQFDIALSSASVEQKRVIGSSSTPEQRDEAQRRLDNARQNIVAFEALCVLGMAMNEPIPTGVCPQKKLKKIDVGTDQGIMNYTAYPYTIGLAVQHFLGRPCEAYIRIGNGPFLSNCNYSLVFLWESDGGVVGVERLTRYVDLYMYAAIQQMWQDPNTALNAVASKLLNYASPEYRFRMRGLPIQLPEELPRGYTDWTHWVELAVDHHFCQQNLISDGFLILGSDGETVKVLQAASQLMLPNWWEKKVG